MRNISFPFSISSSLINIGLRHLRRHLWQSVLMVLGITMGVAVVIGIDIANESASRAFDLSTKSLTGRTTHTISSGSKGVNEVLYLDLRRSELCIAMAPVVSAYVSSPQLGGVTLQMLGVDPFAEAPFRDYLGGAVESQGAGLSVFLTQPGGVLISEDLATRYALALGSRVDIDFSGRTTQGEVVGLLNPGDDLSRRALNGMLIMDIASAQELTGRVGVLDRIDLIMPEEKDGELEAIQTMLPAGVLMLPATAQNGTVQEMTAAFRLNLTALSMLAMVVALFLIYNTMTFSVVQRREMFGTLRCLGVTRREVFMLVVVEAIGVGAIGAILGTLLGILMGRGAVQLVTQTINDLFFVTTVRDIPVPILSLVKGNLLGIIATVITAALPAWEAASVPPRTALSRSGIESKARAVIPWIAAAGIVLILAGTGTLSLPTDSLPVSFAGTFVIVIGMAMLTPLVTIWLMAAAERVSGRIWAPLGRMAPREVVNAISRTAIAVAALMVAVAVTIGVSLMVNSFRFTVVTWLDQILHGDIYLSVPGSMVSQPTYPIDPQVIKLLQGREEILRLDLLQTVVVDSLAGPIQVSANNNPNDGMEQIYRAVDHPLEAIDTALQRGAVLASEPLANRLALPEHGGVLSLYTPQGLQDFPIAGIYYDYTSSSGNLIMSLDVYRRIWQDEAVTAIALILEPGQDVDQVAEALEKDLGEIQRLLVRPNQALRTETMEIFDRTFAITGALQLMTTFVAFVGVLSAMMSLQLDKKRQLGILRAVGLTTRQLWRLVSLETGLMGFVAGIFAMPTGYILALILIYIINLRSFGWTLQMQVEPEPFLQALIVAVAASMLAGVITAWRIVQGNITDTIRFE